MIILIRYEWEAQILSKADHRELSVPPVEVMVNCLNLPNNQLYGSIDMFISQIACRLLLPLVYPSDFTLVIDIPFGSRFATVTLLTPN